MGLIHAHCPTFAARTPGCAEALRGVRVAAAQPVEAIFVRSVWDGPEPITS
jgi:hypothetical protein